MDTAYNNTTNAQETRTVTLKRKVTLRRKVTATTTADKVQYLTERLYDGLKNMSFTAPLVEYIAANIEDGDILNELREVRPMLILQANPPHNICDKYGAEMESYLSNEYGLTDLTPEMSAYILVVEIICAPHLIQLTA